MGGKAGTGGHESVAQGEREELRSDELSLGSVVTIETESGSTYRLEITDIDDVYPKGVLSRQSDHEVGGETEVWEQVEADTSFELKGSCEKVLSDGLLNILPADQELNVLRIGNRALLGTMLRGVDKTLVTSPIKSISLG